MFLRSQPQAAENRITDRASRLAVAAFTGAAVIPPSPDEEALFAALEPLEVLDDDELFRELARREPRLADLEAAVRVGRFPARSRATGEPSDPRQRLVWSMAWLEERNRLTDELTALVGPGSGAADPVLRTSTARARLSFYLNRLAEDVADAE